VLSLALALTLAADFRWPEVDGIVGVVDVPPVTSQGTPTLLRAVKVKRSTAALMPIFRDAFVKAGLWVPRPPKLIREPTLTALDPLQRRSYTVVFQPNPDGTTTLILGEANHAVRIAADGALAPLFPGAANVFRSAHEGGRLEAYEARATASEVRAFYAEVLPKLGWQPDGDEGYRRGKDEELTLSVVKASSSGLTRVSVFSRR
jgi:hypothetical protein